MFFSQDVNGKDTIAPQKDKTNDSNDRWLKWEIYILAAEEDDKTPFNVPSTYSTFLPSLASSKVYCMCCDDATYLRIIFLEYLRCCTHRQNCSCQVHIQCEGKISENFFHFRVPGTYLSLPIAWVVMPVSMVYFKIRKEWERQVSFVFIVTLVNLCIVCIMLENTRFQMILYLHLS